MADVFFAAAGTSYSTVHALFGSIFQLLEKHGVKRDMPTAFTEDVCYVTEPLWKPRMGGGIGGKTGNSTELPKHKMPLQPGQPVAFKPSAQQLDAFMAASSRDWTVPLHPSGRGYREKLTGPGGIKNEEWAQAHYGEMITDAYVAESS